ncbi:DUF975 family protein [Lacticaseibacillus daqingensis]|uniref:DUF975 family protein n=1 Tax=Lacticaseibacillus daqingensis TaxID=2486014 RepID=UPI000F7943DD|nr:DUF975 family protein [Lacticaseibacillus daqingensis]
MEDHLLTRRDIKRRAKQQLHEGTVYRDLIMANLIPWLIGLAFAVFGVWLAFETITKFGVQNIAANPENFVDYYTGKNNGANRQMMQGLVGLWFTQGVAFTALDVARGKVTSFSPFKAVFRTFNGRYFFGLLWLWLVSSLLIGMGIVALIVPGILLTFGLSMAYYAYYDGRETGKPYGIFTALGDSWRIMSGNKFELFVLQLSLLGWFILKNLTLHLFDLLINPYLQLVTAGFYANVRADYDRNQRA